jgi:hypothetical protein
MSTSARRLTIVYHLENVFDWRSGPRRGSSVKMAAPIPTNPPP